MIIAYCTGLIAVCTVLLFVTTVLTIRSYNMLRNISHGEAGAHDEAQIRLSRAARAEQSTVAAETVPVRSAPVLRTRSGRPAPEQTASAERSAPAVPEPAPAAPEPKAPKTPRKRNVPIARYDSNLEETMGATEWTGPVTTYIPENRSPQKP
jgi:hypothetical protein